MTGGDRQQRGGDPVAAHVEDAQADVPVAQPEYVQVVPGELAARLERPREVRAWKFRWESREERPLDCGGGLQIPCQPVVGGRQFRRRRLKFLVVSVKLPFQ